MEEHVSGARDESQPAARNQPRERRAVIDRDQWIVRAVDDEGGNGQARQVIRERRGHGAHRRDVPLGDRGVAGVADVNPRERVPQGQAPCPQPQQSSHSRGQWRRSGHLAQ